MIFTTLPHLNKLSKTKYTVKPFKTKCAVSPRYTPPAAPHAHQLEGKERAGQESEYILPFFFFLSLFLSLSLSLSLSLPLPLWSLLYTNLADSAITDAEEERYDMDDYGVVWQMLRDGTRRRFDSV
jgi:hypothetical protein